MIGIKNLQLNNNLNFIKLSTRIYKNILQVFTSYNKNMITTTRFF